MYGALKFYEWLHIYLEYKIIMMYYNILWLNTIL